MMINTYSICPISGCYHSNLRPSVQDSIGNHDEEIVFLHIPSSQQLRCKGAAPLVPSDHDGWGKLLEEIEYGARSL